MKGGRDAVDSSSSMSASMPRNLRGTKRREGERVAETRAVNCTFICVAFERYMRERGGTRGGGWKGGWVITENGNARVNDWKARSRNSRRLRTTTILTSPHSRSSASRIALNVSEISRVVVVIFRDTCDLIQISIRFKCKYKVLLYYI